MYTNITDHSFFTDCANKIRSRAAKAFEEKSKGMDDESRSIAYARMNRELEIIIDKGYATKYYLFMMIADYALLMRRLISIQGSIAYSYVAYLLGLTTVDAFKMDYPFEMLTDYNHDRSPFMIIYTSAEFKRELVGFIHDIFESEYITHTSYEDILVSGLPNENGKIDLSTIRITILERDLIPAVEKHLFSTKTDRLDLKTAMILFDSERSGVLRPTYPTGKYKVFRERLIELIFQYLTNDDPEDIPEEYYEVLDDTYDGLLKFIAILRGRGIMEADFRDNSGNRIYTRDDLVRYGKEVLRDEEEAYRFMNKIRRGFVSENYSRFLADQGISDEDIEKLERFSYVLPEGDLIPDIQCIVFLASIYYMKN